MSELFEEAIAQVMALSAEAQDEAGRLLLDWTRDLGPAIDHRSPEPVEPGHEAAVAEALADVRAGRIASKEDIEAAYGLFRSGR